MAAEREYLRGSRGAVREEIDTGVKGRTQYQWELRTIGTYLDDHPVRPVTILETATGFLVRQGMGTPDSPLESHLVTHEELLETAALLRQRRGPRRLFSRQHTGAAGGIDSYQDVLRALGYELDRVPAYTITLDEVGEALMLTYLYDDPSKGYLLQKRMLATSPQDRESLLRDAYARRGVVEPTAR